MVIVNEKGQFYAVGRWVSEYPDAYKFRLAPIAVKMCTELSEIYGPCSIVIDYGLESERQWSN